MSTRKHRPAAYSLDDPHVIVAEKPDRPLEFVEAVDGDKAVAVVEKPATVPAKKFRWAALFWSAAGGLISLAFGLAISRLVEDLFARSAALGWIGLVLAVVAAVALAAIIAREVRGLLRLSAIEGLREQAADAVHSDERSAGVAVARALLNLTRNIPTLARGRAQLSSHLDDIIDGADMVRLSERHLMAPLDQEAVRLVSGAAKRVSVVTAVSPRALVDTLFVLITALMLIRRLAYLYGGRPGALGSMRLMKLCVAHLTVTGSMAVGDSLLQQALGHGIVAKLSTRLGEGVLNGLLTARLGLAAIEVVRPLPFVALPRPAISDLAAGLVSQRESPAP